MTADKFQEFLSSCSFHLFWILQKYAANRISLVFDLQAMKHLMLRRPLDANRMEFFAHAETFAALVQLDFVLVPGTEFAILFDRLLSMHLFSEKNRKDLAATRNMLP